MATRYGPVTSHCGGTCHRSIRQVEYATDRVFHRQADLRLIDEPLVRGEWQISGIRNASLRRVLPDCSAPQGARLLRRLHLDGLIKKVGRSYTSDLTESGRRVLLTP